MNKVAIRETALSYNQVACLFLHLWTVDHLQLHLLLTFSCSCNPFSNTSIYAIYTFHCVQKLLFPKKMFGKRLEYVTEW